MKSPPTTGRDRCSTAFASRVSYQSQSGRRSGVACVAVRRLHERLELRVAREARGPMQPVELRERRARVERQPVRVLVCAVPSELVLGDLGREELQVESPVPDQVVLLLTPRLPLGPMRASAGNPPAHQRRLSPPIPSRSPRRRRARASPPARPAPASRTGGSMRRARGSHDKFALCARCPAEVGAELILGVSLFPRDIATTSRAAARIARRSAASPRVRRSRRRGGACSTNS